MIESYEEGRYFPKLGSSISVRKHTGGISIPPVINKVSFYYVVSEGAFTAIFVDRV
jgi:hypothetical protein